MSDELNQPGAEDQNVETPDTDTPDKAFTEAEVQEMLQKEADRRVSAALKKQQEKFEAKMAEAEKLRGMDEKDRAAYEFEQKVKAFEDERKEFSMAQNKLEAAKVLSNRGLPVSLVDYVVAETAESMMENITTFERIFKSAVNDAVAQKIASPTPKGGGVPQTGLTREQFNKLSIVDQQELYKTNPDLYRQLTR
jgi:predicted nucleic acid-binding protein